MPHRDHAPTGAPCWIELLTSDPDVTRPFYETLFGWKAEEPNADFGGYFNFHLGDDLVAGGMANDGTAGTPDAWTVYLATADAEATAAAVLANSGTVQSGPHPVGDLGAMVVMADPGGAMLGAWQPGTHPGFTTLAEPGAPAWFELHTHDYDAVVAFYEAAFDWDTHVMADSPEFRYTNLGEGDGALAGIMDDAAIGSSDPAHWASYFMVTDVDASVAQAVDLGASVIHDPQDTPFGRLATLTDPTGAQFRVMTP